jgi:uncharacterized caspase-like protein
MDTPGQSINDLMISVRRDVIKDTRDFQRPWEQGSLTERFEFVPAAATAVASEKAVVPDKRVAALPPLEDQAKAEIREMIVTRYLKPDPQRIEERVRELFADSVASFGRQVDIGELVDSKVQWFAKWDSWRLNMLPDSLKITFFDEEAVRAEFDLRYKYVPKDKGTGPFAGTSHIFLDLVKIDGRWKIEMENSQ